MSELWIPTPEENIDASNVFTMAAYLRQKLNEISDVKEYDAYRKFIFEQLENHIKADNAHGKEYVVDSGAALLEDASEYPIAAIENVRVFGMVAAIGTVYTREFPVGMTLKLDAYAMAPLDTPDDTSNLFQLVATPLVHVKHAEVLSA